MSVQRHHHTGEQSVGMGLIAGEPPVTYKPNRKCRRCGTKLSIYNSDPWCSIHVPPRILSRDSVTPPRSATSRWKASR